MGQQAWIDRPLHCQLLLQAPPWFGCPAGQLAAPSRQGQHSTTFADEGDQTAPCFAQISLGRSSVSKTTPGLLHPVWPSLWASLDLLKPSPPAQPCPQSGQGCSLCQTLASPSQRHEGFSSQCRRGGPPPGGAGCRRRCAGAARRRPPLHATYIDLCVCVPSCVWGYSWHCGLFNTLCHTPSPLPLLPGMQAGPSRGQLPWRRLALADRAAHGSACSGGLLPAVLGEMRCAALCLAVLRCAVLCPAGCHAVLLPLSGRHARWKIRQLAGNCCRCQPTCMLQETPGCGAFTWNPTQGGSCYLKAPSGWTVTQPGDASQSGVLVPAASEAAQEPSQPTQEASQPTQKPAPNAGTPPPAGVHPLPGQPNWGRHRCICRICWSCPGPGRCVDHQHHAAMNAGCSALIKWAPVSASQPDLPHSTPRLHCTALHCTALHCTAGKCDMRSETLTDNSVQVKDLDVVWDVKNSERLPAQMHASQLCISSRASRSGCRQQLNGRHTHA